MATNPFSLATLKEARNDLYDADTSLEGLLECLRTLVSGVLDTLIEEEEKHEKH